MENRFSVAGRPGLNLAASSGARMPESDQGVPVGVGLDDEDEDHPDPRVAFRLDHAIADVAGRPGYPWRRLDALTRMVRAGTITLAMQRAGEVFHRHFQMAGLDPLWAPDPARVPVLTHSDRPWGRERGSSAALRRVMLALDAVGGVQEPGGSCAWHVLGLEMPVREWALSRSWRGCRIDPRTASGVLIIDLSLLCRHYALMVAPERA